MTSLGRVIIDGKNPKEVGAKWMDGPTRNLARHIGKRVRRARIEAGLTGVELARAIGKSQAFISDVERGRKLPSLITLLNLGKFLNRSPEFFIPASFLAGYSEAGESHESDAQPPALRGPVPPVGATFLETLRMYLAEDRHPWSYLEDHAGLSVSTIDHIMQGFIPPRPIVCRIAEALGVDPKYLLMSAGFDVATPEKKTT